MGALQRPERSREGRAAEPGGHREKRGRAREGLEQRRRPPWLGVEEGWLRMGVVPRAGDWTTEVWPDPGVTESEKLGVLGRLGEQAGAPARGWGCA